MRQTEGNSLIRDTKSVTIIYPVNLNRTDSRDFFAWTQCIYTLRPRNPRLSGQSATPLHWRRERGMRAWCPPVAPRGSCPKFLFP